jgi:hypothetical protein
MNLCLLILSHLHLIYWRENSPCVNFNLCAQSQSQLYNLQSLHLQHFACLNSIINIPIKGSGPCFRYYLSIDRRKLLTKVTAGPKTKNNCFNRIPRFSFLFVQEVGIWTIINGHQGRIRCEAVDAYRFAIFGNKSNESLVRRKPLWSISILANIPILHHQTQTLITKLRIRCE